MIIKTISFAVIAFLTIVAYNALIAYVPVTRSVAVAFPVLAAVPLVGAWLAQWSFAAIGGVALFGFMAKKVG